MIDEPLTGKLVVATPGLVDPNFDRSVVLILEHNDDGALGLVLNRRTDGDLVDALPQWVSLAADPPRIFQGGPVEQNSVICLAETGAEPAPDDEGFQELFGTIATLDLSRDPTDFEVSLVQVRVFAGYSGWGGGQLETEIEAGGWFVLDAKIADVFTPEPDSLWRRVLGRQKGNLAMVALFPDDPSQN